MITSQQIQNLNLGDFSILYSQSIINEEIEKILRKVFEEQCLKKNKILLYDLSNISELYYIHIRDAIEKKLHVSSIYINYKTLYVDWSI